MKRQELNMLEQQELIEVQKRSFICLKCTRYARGPVLTQCGHLFCWQCLYKTTLSAPQCPFCKQIAKCQQCYPVYTQHHEQQGDSKDNQQPNSQNQLSSQEQMPIPPRPQAKHRLKILNPNMIGVGMPLSSSNLPSNLNREKMLAGHVYLSSLGINALSTIEQGNSNDQDYEQGQKYKLRMHLAIVCTILVILYFLVK